MIRVIIALLLVTMVNTVGADVTYKVGVVPQFKIRKIISTWQPVLNEIEAKTGIKLELVGSTDIPVFEKAFINGEYDFAYMNPYHAVVANNEQNYQPIIRDVGRSLYGIIVVRKDSTIKNLEDLRNKTIAFPAPNALGAALIPRAEFATKYRIEIKPVYVKSHTSVYYNVITGLADAGGGVQKTFDSQEEKIRNELRVLYETRKVSPHPLVVHPRVPAEVVKKIQKAFIDMGSTIEGSAMLSEIPMKKAGKASMADYEDLKSMGLEKFWVK